MNIIYPDHNDDCLVAGHHDLAPDVIRVFQTGMNRKELRVPDVLNRTLSTHDFSMSYVVFELSLIIILRTLCSKHFRTQEQNTCTWHILFSYPLTLGQSTAVTRTLSCRFPWTPHWTELAFLFQSVRNLAGTDVSISVGSDRNQHFSAVFGTAFSHLPYIPLLSKFIWLAIEIQCVNFSLLCPTKTLLISCSRITPETHKLVNKATQTLTEVQNSRVCQTRDEVFGRVFFATAANQSS